MVATEAASAVRATSTRPVPGTACRRSQADRRRRRPARIAADPPLIVPVDDLLPDVGRSASRTSSAADPVLRPHPAVRPAQPAGAATGSSTWPARSSASAASAPAAGSSSCWAGTTHDPLFLQAKEAEAVGARRVRRPERVPQPGRARRSQASGSCRRPATSSSAGSGSTGIDGASATSTSASCATGRARPTSSRWCLADGGLRANCAVRRWPARTRGPATGSRSPPTWARSDVLRPGARRVRRALRRPERA